MTMSFLLSSVHHMFMHLSAPGVLAEGECLQAHHTYITQLRASSHPVCHHQHPESLWRLLSFPQQPAFQVTNQGSKSNSTSS